MRIVLCHGLLALVFAETQQNYYLTRTSLPFVEQPSIPGAKLGIPILCEYPQPVCDDDHMDQVAWHSKEIKDAVVMNGQVLGLFECVTFTLCGYRIYDDTNSVNTSSNSSPKQFLIVYESRGVLGSNCSELDFPPMRCPNATLGCCMGSKAWHTHGIIRGQSTPNNGVQISLSDCGTYSLCAHRIYNAGQQHASWPSQLQATLPDTPLQYIEVKTSAPFIGDANQSTCGEFDYPDPVR
jgi:hypothetical protein